MSLQSGLSVELDSAESLARFLNRSKDVAKTTGRIKPAAFLPDPHDNTSVFRTTSLSATEICTIGVENHPAKGKNGAAIVAANEVTKIELTLKAKEPPLRHAEIHDWDWNSERDVAKQKRKEKAALLAAASSFQAPTECPNL